MGGAGVNDLYVFRVDTTSATPGLTLIGTIAHDDSVFRSVEVNDRLISISPDTIEVHDFSQPDAVIASLTINTPVSNPWLVEPFPILLPDETISPPLEMPGTIQVLAVPAGSRTGRRRALRWSFPPRCRLRPRAVHAGRRGRGSYRNSASRGSPFELRESPRIDIEV